MNEHENYELAVENAKEIQWLKDNIAVQNMVNTNHNRRINFLAVSMLFMSLGVYMIGNFAEALKKRLDVIEGVEKKDTDTTNAEG